MQDTNRKQKLLWYYRCTFKELAIPYEEYVRYSVYFEKETTYVRLSSKAWDFINSSIFEALHTYEVVITKDELKEYILAERIWNPYRKEKFYRWRNWHLRHDGPSKHYTRKSHHKPKVLDEKQIAKNEYRLKKGIAKDKSKAYYRRGAGKHYKQLSNQMHRAWEREKINNGQWDDMCNNDYKYFLDPWLWD